MSRTIVTVGAPTTTAFGALTGSTTILAANNRRAALMVYNDLDVDLFILLQDGTVSTTNYHVKLQPEQLYETPPRLSYKGVVKAIQSGGTAGRVQAADFID